MSSKSPFSLSRQGTLRSSHRRKHSTAHSLNLKPGNCSPQQLSPSGRRSPVFLPYDGTRSPLDLLEMRKSPTALFPERIRSPTSGRRSPLGFPELGGGILRSPTSTVQVQQLRFEDGRRSPTVQVQGRRSPIGFSQGLITCIPILTPTDKRSPTIGTNTLHIPPITVSNPSETCAIIEKTLDSIKIEKTPPSDSSDHRSMSPAQSTSMADRAESPPRKEVRSVMRELLAFVRKPSKKAASRTGKFAAAFTRTDPNSATPLIRQSTYSSSPAASSRAAKSAVTKQLSEIAFEPKMSLKLLNSKMSLRLRRTTDKSKEKKSSGDELSDMDSSDSKPEKVGSSSSDVPFELDHVRFEKVGESYIKHDKIREETLEDKSPSPVQAATTSTEFEKCLIQLTKELGNGNANVASGQGHQGHAAGQSQRSQTSVDSIREDGSQLLHSSTEHSGIDSKIELLKSTLEQLVLKPDPIYANLMDLDASNAPSNVNDSNADGDGVADRPNATMQCPTFEIMPPSRRSSFDPPRSPYLENLRSPCSTETDGINLNRLDSAGDSFEMVDTDRNRESSFESRYPSSSHTSFDISRYQSTSYEDQTSSFEIIDIDNQRSGGSGSDDKRSPFDLRKSSIELVDVDTFQKSGSSGGRKSSLETHFDFEMPVAGSSGSRLSTPRTRKQISEPNNKHQSFPTLGMKTHHSAPHRARSPLSNQTSSNYSSRDSYDSSFEHHSAKHGSHTGGGAGVGATGGDPPRQHFPLAIGGNNGPETRRTFLCTDQRCSSIFEPRPHRTTSPYLSSHLTSSSEFEPPSPRRAASASPKHTFTFRIVMKKVDSSPETLCPSTERRRSKDRTDRIRRRDSRKKRFWETGKSF